MTFAHVSALLLAFVLYISLAVAFFGWGKLAVYLLGHREQSNRTITPFIWMGWAFSLFILQLIHFFSPLNVFVIIPLLIVGVALAIPSIVAALLHPIHLPSARNLLVILVITAFLLMTAVYIASRSMLPPESYDSGLYHFNKIRWINTFPIVPGLGNLHGRLAFNQSFFAYVAALNFFPFFGHGRSIANSFLLLLTIATCIDLLRPVLKRPSILVTSHPFQYISIILVLPVLWYLTFYSSRLAVPTPDLASSLLQLTMIVVLAQGIAEWISGKSNQNFRAIFLALLAITTVTIKLSNLAYSAVILSFILFYAIKPQARPVAVRIFTLSALMIVVWCLQGFILSGAPLYPSTIGYIPTDWAVPLEKVIDEANWVYSNARQPGTHWSKVLGNWNWLGPWFITLLSQKIRYVTLFFPLALAGFFVMIVLMMRCLNIGNRLKYLEWAILIPSISGLIYWFFTAPNPRFAHALFFILLMCTTLLLVRSIQSVLSKRSFLIAVFLILLVANLNFAAYAVRNIHHIGPISVSGWHPVKSAPVEEKITASGLLLYTPKRGELSWDSPLPSTPYFNDQLRLRNPESLSFGFSVTREEE